MLFYSATLIYDYNEVAVMIFAYDKVRFKIWDAFIDFIGNNNNLVIRFSVYNPLFMMPSQMPVPFLINIPP